MIEIDEKDVERFAIGRVRQFLMWFARSLSFPFIDIFLKILNRSSAIGYENIPKEGGALFACNHVSGVDTMLIPAFAINRGNLMPFMAPAKEELFRVPFVGTIISLWGAFPVKRRARDLDSMRRIGLYARRYHVMLFPEGTRAKQGELLRGRAGVGWITYNARPTVIPTLVINTDYFYWPGRKRPWFGVPYKVVFGQPLDLGRFYDMPDNKVTSQAIADEIMRALARLRVKHQGDYLSPPRLTGYYYPLDKWESGDEGTDEDLGDVID